MRNPNYSEQITDKITIVYPDLNSEVNIGEPAIIIRKYDDAIMLSQGPNSLIIPTGAINEIIKQIIKLK